VQDRRIEVRPVGPRQRANLGVNLDCVEQRQIPQLRVKLSGAVRRSLNTSGWSMPKKRHSSRMRKSLRYGGPRRNAKRYSGRRRGARTSCATDSGCPRVLPRMPVYGLQRASGTPPKGEPTSTRLSCHPSH
jgi:hypothetical protein